VFRLPKTAVAVVCLITGLVCLGLWRLVGGTETQPFAPGAAPPQYVRVTSGNTYHLAVPGGVPALLSAGLPLSGGASGSSPDLECAWNSAGFAAQPLRTTPESSDTKATDVIGSFVAPVTGRIHVDCQHWGPVFVPDADDASGDPAGWLLVTSTVLLLIGGAAALSSGWAYDSRRAAGAPAEPDPEARVEVGELAVEDAQLER
jgi:hypothetical protein